MSVLALSGIGKRFGKTVALSDISLLVNSGEFICLLGESGCGKTTLLRIIAGLESHDNGTMQLNDADLSGIPCHKRNIGMVFQSLALFPHLNVGQNIAYGLRMRGATQPEKDEQTSRLLQMVGLPEFSSRQVSSLSGGQKQRVAIARALALQPQLFLMDEPFSALDAGLREHLQQEVKRLQQDLRITTIFVTHDQREAMALADRIVVLNNGQIEQTGTPAEVYQQPATRFVANFIGANNVLDVSVNAGRVFIEGYDLGQASGLLSTIDGACTAAIRPEALSLEALSPESTSMNRANGAGSHSALTGSVKTRRPVGALVEHEIDINGQLIKQTAFQTSAGEFNPGDRVSVNCDWSQAWVIPD